MQVEQIEAAIAELEEASTSILQESKAVAKHHVETYGGAN